MIFLRDDYMNNNKNHKVYAYISRKLYSCVKVKFKTQNLIS